MGLMPTLASGTHSCKLAGICNHHWLRCFARLGTHGLDRLHDIHAFGHLAKDDVLPIEPLRLDRAQEELGAIGVRTSIGHGQDARTCVLQSEVLICKLLTVDGLSACSIACGEVSALAHEIR